MHLFARYPRRTLPARRNPNTRGAALLLLCLALSALAVVPAPGTAASEDGSRGTALHRVRVIDGYADREYAERGDVVAVRAAYPNSWWRFDIWVSEQGGGIQFANRTRPATTFVMPDRAVTVRALFIPGDYDDHGIAVGGCTTAATAPLPLLLAAFALVRNRKAGKHR